MGGLGRQAYTAFAESICIMSCGMAYGWVSPIIGKLTAKDGEIRATKDQISWIAADIELGNMLTPFLASYLMDKFGRKGPMLLTAPIIMISWIITLTTRSVESLYVKRVLEGMGLGFALTIAPIYIAEIAEANIRGSISISITITWYVGMVIQFCIGTFLSYNVAAWINLVIPILYFILFLPLPESPYYLMMKKQEDKAAESLAWFRGVHPNQVSEELNSIAEFLEKDAQNKESWKLVMNNTVYRKCFSVMIVVMLATIMSGLTTVFAYATEIFAEASSSGFLNADTCAVAISVLFLIVSIVISFLIDKVGRRPLLIISALGCCISSLSSAIFFYFKENIKYKWILFVTIGSYCLFASIGLSPVMLAFQGELFPPSIKGITAGTCMVFITFVSLVALKLYYIVDNLLGMYVNYLIYSIVAGLSTVWLYFNAPETKNKTFNELSTELEGLYVQKRLKHTEELQSLQRNHVSL